jgi:transcriptional regulator with XRE-family HTH domain
MSEAASRARAQIQSYLNETGWTPTQLAKRAGVRASTVTRFMNSPTFKSVPNTTTLVKLEAAVTTWRAARHDMETVSAALASEQAGRFVDQPEQLAWLDLWDAIPATDRRRAVLILRALALDPSKFG